jgi:hypothetical protein
MRLRAQKIRDGLHPSEVVVAVATTEGRERLVVNSASFTDNSLEIGYPINRDQQDNYLVELPQETDSGTWRVWVPETEVSDA